MAETSQAIVIRNSKCLSACIVLPGSMVICAVAWSAIPLLIKLLFVSGAIVAQYQCWKGQQLWPRSRLLTFTCSGHDIDLLSSQRSARPYFVSYHSEYLIMLEARRRCPLEAGESQSPYSLLTYASTMVKTKLSALQGHGQPRFLVLCPDMTSRASWSLMRRSALQGRREASRTG